MDLEQSIMNRNAFPPEELARLAGKHVAWSPDGLRILASDLEQVSRQVDVATTRDLADRIRRRLEGRPHSDSAELIREDRER